MGHNRLGRLPKTHKWAEVMELLGAPHPDETSVASAVAKAADSRLRELANDPGLGYSFWLLVRITLAARSQSFVDGLAKLNIPVSPDASTLHFISEVADSVRSELSRTSSPGDFAEIGSLALRTALTDTVGQQGRSLFNSSIQDLQSAFRAYSTEMQFSTVAHRFFADFFARVVRSYVDRDIANHVGPGESFVNVGESTTFLNALDLHARQSARIVQEYAGSWYSKHNWETKGEISQEETQRFAAYALKKLRAELKQQVGAA